MKRLNIEGVDAAPKKTKASNRVVLNVDETAMQLLGQFIVINPQFKDLKKRSEAISKQLAPLIKSAWFTQFDKMGVPDETLVVSVGGREVKMIVKNRYSTQVSDEKLIVAAIGQEKTDRYFKFATKLALDLDTLPDEVAEKFGARVVELAKEMGAMPAVTATECIQPRAGFHESRTVALSKEENIRLDGVLGITAYPLL